MKCSSTINRIAEEYAEKLNEPSVYQETTEVSEESGIHKLDSKQIIEEALKDSLLSLYRDANAMLRNHRSLTKMMKDWKEGSISDRNIIMYFGALETLNVATLKRLKALTADEAKLPESTLYPPDPK